MQGKVRQLAGKLSKDAMRVNLDKLNGFYNRYYMSEFGRQSSRWVLERVQDAVEEAGADDTVTVEAFTHPWPQISTIARIQGRTNNTIIIGAHQDSITPYELTRQNVSALGPEDGSGAITIMEVFRALLNDKDVVGGLAQNTMEFHWYSAESVGLLGSQEIFRSYVKNDRKVKAMIQQDMVGYVQGVSNTSKPETLGVVTDYTHLGLNTFIRTVIDEVTFILSQLIASNCISNKSSFFSIAIFLGPCYSAISLALAMNLQRMLVILPHLSLISAIHILIVHMNMLILVITSSLYHTIICFSMQSWLWA